jgi:NADH:ubiquinone oxidoreductase subunit 6 (subunit J)
MVKLVCKLFIFAVMMAFNPLAQDGNWEYKDWLVVVVIVLLMLLVLGSGNVQVRIDPSSQYVAPSY